MKQFHVFDCCVPEKSNTLWLVPGPSAKPNLNASRHNSVLYLESHLRQHTNLSSENYVVGLSSSYDKFILL